MDQGVWWATVHGLAKSQTQLKQLSEHVHTHTTHTHTHTHTHTRLPFAFPLLLLIFFTLSLIFGSMINMSFGVAILGLILYGTLLFDFFSYFISSPYVKDVFDYDLCKFS